MKFRKCLITAMAVGLVAAFGFFGNVEAAVVYLPDVTEAMTEARFWSQKQQGSGSVLLGRDAIDSINAAGIAAGADTRLQDLKSESETNEFFTADRQIKLKNAAESELKASFIGKAEDENGNKLTKQEAEDILDNYLTDGSAPAIPSKFAIVTTHTTMRAFPTDRMLGLTPGDRDDDNLYLAALCVNEPLIVRTASADGQFMLCMSSCMEPLWVPTRDIAICKDKNEWLAAWDIPAGNELVITGYKVRTEKTRQTPNTADRMLYMGTTLERIDNSKAETIVGSRSTHYNHVCYLPVRDSDGRYSKEVALIAQSNDVSEGFLPLTKENIARVAFNSLGQMYGWGGMLDANDCSGYVRDVYKCFGLRLPRNTTWQQNMPVCKYDLSKMDDTQKAVVISNLPLGTVLFFRGHEMMYLGSENGKLYVISALGSIGNIYGKSGTLQIKSVAINTLDMIRGNRSTWLKNLTTAVVPFMTKDQAMDPSDISFYKESIVLDNASFIYNGKVQTPKVISVGDDALKEGTDYTVSLSDPKSKKAGQYSVTLTGMGNYSGQVKLDYVIAKANINNAKVSLSKKNYTYNGKAQKPVIKSVKGKKLKEGVDYTTHWSNPEPTDAGTYSVTITGKGLYVGQTTATFTIKKANNPLQVKSGKINIDPAALEAGTQTFNITDSIKFTKPGQGTITYTKTSGNKAITLDPATGVVTVEKGLKKGSYSIRFKVNASGNNNYKASTKSAGVTIAIKP